jgi:hypothetical protein
MFALFEVINDLKNLCGKKCKTKLAVEVNGMDTPVKDGFV